MTRRLSDRWLCQLSEFVARRLGLHFPPGRWGDLDKGLQSAAREFGMADIEACARWLLSTPLTREQIDVLASELTIGETYFFRERRSLEVFGGNVLPELIRQRQGGERRLRLWSAGCCTGEEPYSIAIWLDRILPDPRQWPVTILATDVNPRFLKRAVEGIFGEWSFRDAPSWLKEGYFREVGERRFEILPRIKERVTFGYLNLAEDAYPSLTNNTNAMDVIFCRNVLMYFASDPIQQVIQKFHRSLVEGGWLIVSPTETSQQLFSRFASVPFDGGTFYRKEAECGMRKAKDSAAAAAEDERRKAEGGAPVGGFEISNLEFQMPTARPPYEEARGLMAEGNYAEAARRLEEVPGPLQDTAEYWTLQARTCANLGHLAEARRWAEKALAADKLNAGMHYLRAMIVQEQGAAEEASGSLKRALYLDPRFVLAHFALANLELRRRRQREADRHFTNTLRLLDHYQDDEVLPQSEGLAAGRLRDLVRSTLSIERAA